MGGTHEMRNVYNISVGKQKGETAQKV